MSVVADVHVHPGGVGQSASDRNYPMISRAGHIAFILPDFARPPVRHGVVGIYRYLGDKRWHAVPDAVNAAIFLQHRIVRLPMTAFHRRRQTAPAWSNTRSTVALPRASPEAEALLRGYRLALSHWTEEAARDRHHQAALLTAVALGAARIPGRRKLAPCPTRRCSSLFRSAPRSADAVARLQEAASRRLRPPARR